MSTCDWLSSVYQFYFLFLFRNFSLCSIHSKRQNKSLQTRIDCVFHVICNPFFCFHSPSNHYILWTLWESRTRYWNYECISCLLSPTYPIICLLFLLMNQENINCSEWTHLPVAFFKPVTNITRFFVSTEATRKCLYSRPRYSDMECVCGYSKETNMKNISTLTLFSRQRKL